METLEGKVAVVTGGTFGVGRGVASVLAQSGALVFVTGRSEMPHGEPRNVSGVSAVIIGTTQR
jgi:dehydrogenase/reductase SDR family member 1